MKTAADNIKKAKVKLILESPFFATLALKFNYIEDPVKSQGTAGVDNKNIYYDPTFINSLTMDEVTGLLAHEVFHPMMGHSTRRQGRHPKRWNYACDYSFNLILKDGGFKLPQGGCMDEQYRNMSAEEIYKILPEPPGGWDSVPYLAGVVLDANAHTQGEIEEIEAEMKQALMQAVMAAKAQGKIPAGMERLVQEILKPKVNWREQLQRFLTQIANSDYSWAKPNRRYIHSGIYLPSLESIETGEIVLLVDTSGSIDNKLLSKFAGEMQGISNAFKIGFKIVYVDADVCGVQEFEADEDLVLDAKGGGGTDFKPGFEWIDDQGIEPACVVYFTDGYCSDFPKAPEYPTLWAVYGSIQKFEPPFGEVLMVEEDEED